MEGRMDLIILIIVSVFFVITQIADVVTTVLAVRAGASEGNPLIGFIIRAIGLVPALIATKVFVFLAVAAGFYFLPWWLLSAILGLASAGFIAVIINNIIVARGERNG